MDRSDKIWRDGNSEKIQIKVHKNNKSTWKHECEAWVRLGSVNRDLLREIVDWNSGAPQRKIYQSGTDTLFGGLIICCSWIISGGDKVADLRIGG